MKSHYSCSKCKKFLEATTENFYPSYLKLASKNSNRSVISQCRQCSKNYSDQWRKSLKEKGLVRSQKTTTIMAGAVTGTVYIIGPDIPGTPYKIGITSGTQTDKRKTALQTAHWMELKEVWKSNLLDRADIVEKKLHKHYAKKLVRGEWFNLTKDDIKDIPKLINQFEVENEGRKSFTS